MDFTLGKRRWIPVVSAVFIQLCLGSTYIWSVFQGGIAQALFGGNNALAGLTFSLMIATLSVGGIIAGFLRSKGVSSKICVVIGGAVLSVGFIAASFTTAFAPWLLWLTFGVMGGVGMGMAYSTTISTAQKWFPDKKGLVTGLIISALGMGGVLFTPLAEWLMRLLSSGAAGSGELKTFLVLGGLFLIICCGGGFFIVEPPKDYLPQNYVSKQSAPLTAQYFSPKEMLKTYQFYFLALAFLLAVMGGLMVIGFAKPIAQAKGMGEAAAAGVIIISLSNAAGRLFFGFLSDRLGAKRTLIALLSVNTFLYLLVNAAQSYFIFALIAVIGFVYGGFLSLFATITADYFGQKYMTFNYGLVMLGFGAGGVISSFVAGHFKNIAVNDINLMFPAFIIASAASLAALVLIIFIKPPQLKSRL